MEQDRADDNQLKKGAVMITAWFLNVRQRQSNGLERPMIPASGAGFEVSQVNLGRNSFILVIFGRYRFLLTMENYKKRSGFCLEQQQLSRISPKSIPDFPSVN